MYIGPTNILYGNALEACKGQPDELGRNTVEIPIKKQVEKEISNIHKMERFFIKGFY